MLATTGVVSKEKKFNKFKDIYALDLALDSIAAVGCNGIIARFTAV